MLGRAGMANELPKGGFFIELSAQKKGPISGAHILSLSVTGSDRRRTPVVGGGRSTTELTDANCTAV